MTCVFLSQVAPPQLMNYRQGIWVLYSTENFMADNKEKFYEKILEK